MGAPSARVPAVKVRRVIEYEGPAADVAMALRRTLLSAQKVVRPGDLVPGIGLIGAGPRAPKVTISLTAEELVEGCPHCLAGAPLKAPAGEHDFHVIGAPGDALDTYTYARCEAAGAPTEKP